MVKIRFSRIGSKKMPYYRMVAIDARKQRDGRALEIIGHYDPRKETGKLTYNKERLDFWINRGAVLSDSISNLLKDTSVS
ncbi:MAG: hypothetical protein IEMM0003_0078 [bacterium]|nr:MAG: hypothetical protein IEMM0003_0078 [bacterium]